MNNPSNLPNFFIIGAGKSGTTSLYHYLKQHPDVFMSAVKEPLFFAFAGQHVTWVGPGDTRLVSRAVTSLEDYQALFCEGAGRTALGEASSAYLYYPIAAERLRRLVPDAKLIVILRCPADRAYSNWLHARRTGDEPIGDFAQALDAEPERIAAGWSHFFHYRAKGWYFRQLSQWMSVFPRDQFLLNLYEDLQQNPVQLMRRIFQFIGVDPDVGVDTQSKFNVSGGPMGVRVQRLVKAGAPLAHTMLPNWLRSDLKRGILRMGLRKSRMPQSIREQLLTDYAPDIRQLSDLIGRDLSSWLQAGPGSRPLN